CRERDVAPGALADGAAPSRREAETVTTCSTATGQHLEVLPRLNKMDLPAADPDRVAQEIEDVIGIEATDGLLVSAKTGVGVDAVLEAIINRIPPPGGSADAPLQALIVDSWFDNYLGVVSLVRIVNGRLKRRERIQVMATGREYEVDEIGIFTPHKSPRTVLEVGEVGYVIAGIKEIDGAP